MTYRDVREKLRRGAIADAGHVLAEHLRENIATDPKAWAWKLMARHKAGEKLTPVQVKDYQEALQHELAALERGGDDVQGV